MDNDSSPPSSSPPSLLLTAPHQGHPKMTTNQQPTNRTLTDRVTVTSATAAATVVSSSFSSLSLSLSPSRPAAKTTHLHTTTTTTTTTRPSSNHPKTHHEYPRKNKQGNRPSKKKNHKRAVGTTTTAPSPTTGSTTATTGDTAGSIPTVTEAVTMSPNYDYYYYYYGYDYCNDDAGTGAGLGTGSPAYGSSDLVTVHSCHGVPFEIHAVLGHGYYRYYHPMDSSPPPPPETQEQPCAVVYTSFLRHCGNHPVAACTNTTTATTNATNNNGQTDAAGASHGEGGWPEFIVFDVPLEKIDPLRNLLLFLVQQMEQSRFVKGGEIVESDGLVLETSWIIDPTLRSNLYQRFPFLTPTAPTASTTTGTGCSIPYPPQEYHKLLNLKPRFPLEENQRQGYFTSQREWVASTMWGCRPPAPGGHTAFRDAIVDLLTTQLIVPSRFLPWHIDGNPHNYGPANLQAVTIGDALAHPTWYVDWWGYLDGDLDMIAYVRMNLKHFANIFRLRNGSKVFTEFDYHRIRFCLPTSSTAPPVDVPVVVPPSPTPPPSSPIILTPPLRLHVRTPTLHDKTDPSPPSSSTTMSTPPTCSTNRSSNRRTPPTEPCTPDVTPPTVVGIHPGTSGRRRRKDRPPPALVTPLSNPPSKSQDGDNHDDDDNDDDLPPPVDKNKAPDSPPFS